MVPKSRRQASKMAAVGLWNIEVNTFQEEEKTNLKQRSEMNPKILLILTILPLISQQVAEGADGRGRSPEDPPHFVQRWQGMLPKSSHMTFIGLKNDTLQHKNRPGNCTEPCIQSEPAKHNKTPRCGGVASSVLNILKLKTIPGVLYLK